MGTGEWIAIVGVVSAIMIPIFIAVIRRDNQFNYYFKKGWRISNWIGSNTLKPRDLLELRADPKQGYREYFYERPEAASIHEKIKNGEHLLILGNPISGKTRTLYEALKELESAHDILIAKVVDVDPKDFNLPHRLTAWRKAIVVFDDIQKHAEKQNFENMLTEILMRNVIIVATCRLGEEQKLLTGVLKDKGSEIFREPVTLPVVTDELAFEIASECDIELPSSFDHNIGSIFLPLDAMNDRFFNQCTEPEKDVLRSLRRLHFAGVVGDRELIQPQYVKRVNEVLFDLVMGEYDFNQLLKQLEQAGFLKISKAGLKAEEVYLEQIVKDEYSLFENLEEILSIFKGDGEALLQIGQRASAIGDISLDRAIFKALAITAYEEALKVYTLDRFPMDYGMTQNNLGNAYRTLAEVEDKVENCRKAITAYEEALKVFGEEQFPEIFPRIMANVARTIRFCQEQA